MRFRQFEEYNRIQKFKKWLFNEYNGCYLSKRFIYSLYQEELSGQLTLYTFYGYFFNEMDPSGQKFIYTRYQKHENKFITKKKIKKISGYEPVWVPKFERRGVYILAHEI